MTPQQARHAMEFLNRADLKGIEVPAFTEVMTALATIANPAQQEAHHEEADEA